MEVTTGRRRGAAGWSYRIWCAAWERAPSNAGPWPVKWKSYPLTCMKFNLTHGHFNSFVLDLYTRHFFSVTRVSVLMEGFDDITIQEICPIALPLYR